MYHKYIKKIEKIKKINKYASPLNLVLILEAALVLALYPVLVLFLDMSLFPNLIQALFIGSRM